MTTPLAAPGSEPLDLRLATGAVAAWLACVLLLDATTGAVAVAALGSVAVGLLALGAARLVPVRRPVAGHVAVVGPAVALAAFCIALVLIPLAGRIGHARASPLFRLAARHASVTLDLTVAADPVTLAAAGPAGAPRVAVETSADAVRAYGPAVGASGAVLVLGDAGPWRDTLPGQRVRLEGTLQPDLDGSALSVTLFARGSPHLLGVPPWWQRVAGTIRHALRQAASGLPPDERGLLPGLVDGDTADLDPVLAQRFRLAGLTHLVAVSGTNCSLVVGAVLLLLRRARVRPWVSALVGGAVLLMFVVVARPSPSVLRAALMAVVALSSLASGRPRAALPSLAVVVLGLLLWDPTLSASASFAMSALATAALLVIAPGWAVALRRRRVPAGLAESVAVAAAAHVVTAPVVAAISGQVSLVAIGANVLAEPVVAVATIVGFLAAVIAPLGLGAGAALAWVAGWPCRWLVQVADFFGGLHGAVLPWPGGAAGGLALLVVLAVVALASARIGVRRVLAAAAVTALVVLIPVRAVTSAWPPPGWVFTACDIGQGDALLLAAGPHQAVEIDAGPDPVLIDRCLRDLGITSVPLLVLTHLHLDHVGGVVGVAHDRPIGAILAGPLDEPASGSALVHRVATERGLTVYSPVVGTRLQIGAVRLDVLGPARPYRGTRSDPNNSSLVLRATVGGIRILLPGDAEIEAQQAMLAAGLDLRADVLKVPHHGSAYSDPDFLAAVHARLAIVSVGLHNDYGHPSPRLLTTMARLGVPLLRTDRDGDVAVVPQGGRVAAVRHGTAAASAAAAGPGPLVASVPGARMNACQHERSARTISPARSPASSCWSATRTCSSTEPSARSPPPPAGSTPRWSRPSAPAAPSRVPSCTRCSGRRCSAMPA
jgi:competence protein ComEC